MTPPPKTRNRPRKPTWTSSGITEELWRADPSRVSWAQGDPHFNDLVNVLINERDRVTLGDTATLTENARYGLQAGYARALALVRSLALGQAGDPPPLPPQDYARENVPDMTTD